MYTGLEYASKAREIHSKKRISYQDKDCQEWVEYVLQELGVRKENGTVYNWKGTNDMWRNALLWKGTQEECIQQFGKIPEGAWLFKHKYDGGEVKRGYHDKEGNAYHVGIYTGEEKVLDSSTGGVAYRDAKNFNMVGLPFMIDYLTPVASPVVNEEAVVSKADALKALEILTKFVKEC